MTAAITAGRRVAIEYRLSLQDGTVVDATEGEPLVFVVGDGTLDAALEGHLLGLAQGSSTRFLLGPGEAFGPHEPANVHRLPRSEFPPAMALAPGTIIEFETPTGTGVPGTVVGCDADDVEVDFNHPLAGRPFTFEVHVVEVG